MSLFLTLWSRDWPCQNFHVLGECEDGENCKYSHEELTDETRPLLDVVRLSALFDKIFCKIQDLFFTFAHLFCLVNVLCFNYYNLIVAVKWFKCVICCQQSGDDQQENQSPSRKTSNDGQLLIIVFVPCDFSREPASLCVNN